MIIVNLPLIIELNTLFLIIYIKSLLYLAKTSQTYIRAAA